MGLRNADNDLKLSEVSNQVHEISQVFTGAVYDILADIFEVYQKPDEYDQAETLFRVGKHMTALVILAFLQGPEKNATYQDIAQAMIQIEPVDEWKQFIENQFTQREVIGGPAGLAAEKAQELDWDKCCGTLKHPDHVKDTDAAVKKALKKK